MLAARAKFPTMQRRYLIVALPVLLGLTEPTAATGVPGGQLTGLLGARRGDAPGTVSECLWIPSDNTEVNRSGPRQRPG